MKSVAAFPSSRACLERFTSRALMLVFVAALCCTTGARAEDTLAPKNPPRAALEHYNRGRAHYQAGRYREAVVELERALELDPDSPNLVYNVARVHELLGEIDQAIVFYKRYAQMLPPTERDERARVEATLQRLEGARTQVVVPEPSRPPPPQMKRGVADATFWTLLGLSAATLAAGTATGVLALRASDEAKGFVLGKDGSNAQREDKVDYTHRLAWSTDALLLTGTALGVTSILLYALRERPMEAKEPRGARLRFGASSHGAMLSIGGAL